MNATEQAMAEWDRARTPLTPGQRRLKVAEHEAAHAVVADALGLPVYLVAVRTDGSGYTQHAVTEDRAAEAAVAMAGAVWIEHLRHQQWPGGDTGCHADAQRVRAIVDPFNARVAGKRAKTILRERYDEVLDLAERIDQDGTVDYRVWKLQRRWSGTAA